MHVQHARTGKGRVASRSLAVPELFVATPQNNLAAIVLVHCLPLVHVAGHGQNGHGSKTQEILSLMKALGDILKGGAVIAVIVLIVWLLIKTLVWLWGIFESLLRWIFDDVLSLENLNSLGRILSWGAIILVFILVARFVGKALRKK